jgi:hypothetical protein
VSEDRENIFKIMDGIIDQLNRTKKTFILMVITIMVVIPVSFAISFAVSGPPFPYHDGGGPPWWNRGSGPGPDSDPDPDRFWLARAIPFFVAIAWLAVGIRQWLILNKWSKKYETYRELQRKIDEKLADEKNNDESKPPS